MLTNLMKFYDTFKLSILSAILRPKTGLIKPSLDHPLNSPPRADIPKNRQNHFPSVCPTVHLINKFLIFLVWVRLGYPSSCLSWFSSPTSHYYFLASLFGVGYPIDARGYSTCGMGRFWHTHRPIERAVILDLSQGDATGVVLLSLHVRNLCRGNALSRLLWLLG